jgi:hypothetical protein
MYRLIIAIALLSSPALAQTNDSLKDCQVIGQTANGDMVYALGCKALKPENISSNYKPKMAPTDMSETVIPKPGATQTPETTPTTGVNK